MGIKIKLSGVTFTDTSLPKLYPDAMMNPGSLYLFDASNPAGWDLGNTAPSNGSLIPNVAWETAAGLIGSGTRTTLSPTAASSLTATDGIIELTPKKGIHVIMSQSTQAANRNFRVSIPTAIRQYLSDHANTKQFYFSMWTRTTRLATTATTGHFYGLNGSTSANDYLFKFLRDVSDPSSGGKYLGTRNTAFNTLGNSFRNLGVNGFTGTKPTLMDMAWKAGAWNHFAGFELNKSASIIFYRVYIEDLTASGRTYAQADAADYALYQAAFATGGRFNGDTYTSPSTLP